MKTSILLSAFCFLVPLASFSQEVRINGYSGYTFDDRIDSYYSNTDYFSGRINGSFRWGAGIEYLPNDRIGIEVTYLRQDTKAPVSYYSLIEQRKEFDLGINWLLLGGTHYMKVNSLLEPYGGLQGGLAIFEVASPNNNRQGSATKFGWTAKIGSNIYLTPKFGFKVQADISSAVQAFGGSVYFGTGGSGTALSTYSTMLQFNLSGGLFLRISSQEGRELSR